MFHEGALPSSWHDIYCLCWWEGARTGGQRWGEGWLEVKRDISAMSRGKREGRWTKTDEEEEIQTGTSLSAITPSAATTAYTYEFTSGLYHNFGIWISTIYTSQRDAMSALCQSWWSPYAQCLKLIRQRRKKRKHLKRDLNRHLIFKANANICSSLQLLQSKNSPAAPGQEGKEHCLYSATVTGEWLFESNPKILTSGSWNVSK